jgi:Uma2 family endonuclease
MPVHDPDVEQTHGYEPDVEHLITEDDEPVDNVFSEKQQRLLTEPLYSSWSGPGEGRKFLACANVGVFYVPRNNPVVPDVFLSLDVEAHEDLWAKEHRSYFVWEFGKPPDVVIEIVSNKIGGEATEKKIKYARMRVGFYVIFDPELEISGETLTIYRLDGLSFRKHESLQLPEINLGLTLWEGAFEEIRGRWLRWTDQNGELILTGKEQAEKERAEKEKERAEKEKERAEKEAAQQRAEKLSAMLREMGRDPDQI